MDSTPTAGELIRQALMDGEGKRTLARRLAGTDADLVEIERWRSVVVRADRGSEPDAEQSERVSEVFGVPVQLPPHKNHPSFSERMRRLEEVEEALRALGPELARLADRVEALERQAQTRTRPGGSGSGGGQGR